MDGVKQNEVLLKEKDHWLHFSEPRELIVAANLEDVPGSLEKIERLVEQRGWHAAGFVSFEAASAFDLALATHPIQGFPYLWFGLYSRVQLFDLPNPLHSQPILDWQPTMDQDSYYAAFDQIRDYIAQGKTYQVNYTMRLQTKFESNPWEFFLHLVQSQNQHAAYIDTGRYAICSASPELFFELDGEIITSRPMKGTVKRGRTTREDQVQADWLRDSEKNRAENVMIVDMIRNDLGRIAKTGSVQVPALFRVERYPTLWQMTSTVSARTTASLANIFAALFPCASVTGAPKVSTMRIIHELELMPRRIYTGTIGYLSPGRKAQFNVAIRTALIDQQDQQAEYGIGGGIVWDSIQSDEYAEAILKARVLTDTFHPFSLFETMLWTPEEGFFLKEKHVERLLDSANYFNFKVSQQAIEEQLELVSASYTQPQRVRLVLDENGNLEISSTSFALEKKNIRVSLAETAVNSNDVFLFHKTTRREVFESARASRPNYDDVILYNEKGELTEFTIGNLVVELDGKLVTPPVACGLLPGTFRASLLESGEIVERTISIEQLKDCTKIYRVNSLRKWEPVIIL